MFEFFVICAYLLVGLGAMVGVGWVFQASGFPGLIPLIPASFFWMMGGLNLHDAWESPSGERSPLVVRGLGFCLSGLAFGSQVTGGLKFAIAFGVYVLTLVVSGLLQSRIDLKNLEQDD